MKNLCIICGEQSMGTNFNSKLLMCENCDIKNKKKYKRFSIPEYLYYNLAENAARNNMGPPDYLAILMSKDIKENIEHN